MAEKFDRQALFDWVERNAGRMESAVEKGMRTAQETATKINQKLDSNPKTKAIKDKVVSEGSKRFEQLKDVRIGKTRVGDMPSVAQKLAERQLYRMINRLKDSDPEFEWGKFMPEPNRFPVFDAFEKLGLPYGTPFEEVKKTYRSLMREWHPDKHAGDPELEKKATEKTQELTAAYELICQHYGV